MKIIHFSAECYPAAKAGGLGDVVGSLPKYLNRVGCEASVVMPAYQTNWLLEQKYEPVYSARAPLGGEHFKYEVRRITEIDLGFPLYTVHIPGRFDRKGIYVDPVSGHGYWDELERFISFQIAGLDWINTFEELPDIIHCHDHHTGLVPFMQTRCFRYEKLASIPNILTIHNGEYHGEHDMNKYYLLPAFDLAEIGLLEWHHKLNSLATGIKCAWRVTTVSKSYMQELSERSKGLEELISHEWQKTTGIVNGIDTEVWNPAEDPLIEYNFSYDQIEIGKKNNKEVLCREFGLNTDRPVISFIGRLVREKGADLLPVLINHFLQQDTEVNFVILGTGDPELHKAFEELNKKYVGYFDARLEYNEKLAHQIYAGSDFMIMPSRVEPCGLNQMYAMRYATVPIVRAVGGLKDTVKDISKEKGYGIIFNHFNFEEAAKAVRRSLDYFKKHTLFNTIRERLVSLDFSWERSARSYKDLYKSVK